MRELIGRTLGHYRIVEQIGAGGMGVVYRARDERLDRDVAVKVLPEEVAEHQDRLARFEREAKLLASLNHSNIATLHGIEEEGKTRFLVMELVEGQSLATVIARGALPTDEAVPVAIQIAEALEAAHEQGIIHRDLKPANVMVDSEGQVKVLDFGLAKAFDPNDSQQSPEPLSESPTLTADLTRGGVLLGTAAYMSPEQARGKPVDKRADIWAFGCTLFEMLSAKRPFGGSSSTDVLAAIIKEDVDWGLLPVDNPAPLGRLLRRCLTKDPRDRLHDVADARLELQAYSRGDYPAFESTASESKRSSFSRLLPWGVAAVAVLVGFGIGVLLRPSRTFEPGTVTNLQLGVQPAAAIASLADKKAMAISPDGSTIVYLARDEDENWRLYQRSLDDTSASPIPGGDKGYSPFFSPDGKWIGFWNRGSSGDLMKVPVAGGPAALVYDRPLGPAKHGTSWGSDGNIVFGQMRGGIQRVPGDGGAVEEVTQLADGEYAHRHPQILPDGNTLLYTVIHSRTDWDRATVIAQSLKTGQRKILVENGADARYAPTGHLVFMRLGILMAAPFDLESLQVTGGAAALVEDVRQSVNNSYYFLDTYTGQYDFSENGTLVYLTGGIYPDREHSLVWVDHESREEPLGAPPGAQGAPRISPDGKRVAVWNWGFKQGNIWVFDIHRGTFSLLTPGNSFESWPVWTPDSSRITFASNRGGLDSIYWKPADGSGPAERLSDLEDIIPASWSPDGRILACVKTNENSEWDIWMLSRDGDPEPFIESPEWEGWPTFSPDGKWLAYGSGESGQYEVYVTPYPGPGPRIQISTEGGKTPTWAPDGRTLYYSSWWDEEENVPIRAVDISTEGGFSASKPRELFRGGYRDSQGGAGYAMSPDGKRFLMVKNDPQPEENVTHLRVVLNWFEELERLVPTD
jgi:serine/threonine-protein kinase